MRYYDPQNKRLIYIGKQATPEFWDRHWKTAGVEDGMESTRKRGAIGAAAPSRGETSLLAGLRTEITRKKFDRLVVPTTKKHLLMGSRILEGGCGTGVHVYNLMRYGYQCVGVDIAPETVRLAKQAVPEMDIRHGDVRQLPFPDKYFDGYWSIGVIEHFWDGYDEILGEMQRVIKSGGYLFLTFPYMSPLRRLKAALISFRAERSGVEKSHASLATKRVRSRPTADQPKAGFDSVRSAHFAQDDASARFAPPRHFYQFALDHKGVIEKFEANSFELIKKSPFDGFKGMKDEVAVLNFILNPIAKSKKLPARILKVIISKLFQPFAGHCILLVMEKK